MANDSACDMSVDGPDAVSKTEYQGASGYFPSVQGYRVSGSISQKYPKASVSTIIRPEARALISRLTTIGIMAMTLAVFSGCTTLGVCGGLGDAKRCPDRVSPAPSDDTRMPAEQIARDAVPADRVLQIQTAEHASTMMPGFHGGHSTGMVILGVVLMVLVMAVMM